MKDKKHEQMKDKKFQEKKSNKDKKDTKERTARGHEKKINHIWCEKQRFDRENAPEE